MLDVRTVHLARCIELAKGFLGRERIAVFVEAEYGRRGQDVLGVLFEREILVHDAGHQAASLRVAFAPNLGADELVRALRTFECGRVVAEQRDGGNQG